MPVTSASDRDAAITTAASVGCGRLRSSPGTSTSIRTIAAAPTSPVTWVLAPACWATAVREPLVLTGKPWNRPAPTLAAPMPIISAFPFTSWPVRAANDDAVEIVSVRETSAIPSAPATSRGKSETGLGHVREGNPAGSVPTSATPWSERSSAAAAPIATTTAASTPGTLGSQRWRARISDQADQAYRRGGWDRIARREPVNEASSLVDQPIGVDREPEELWQLSDQDRQRQPIHVADLRRL